MTGGGDGSGAVTVGISQSTEGIAIYMIPNDDGELESKRTRQVHAGDTGTYLVFTYTPVETIADGELRFTAPTDWDDVQIDSTREAGYTYATSTDGLIGRDDMDGDTLVVPIFNLDRTC